MPRARELAAMLAERSVATLRNSRVALNLLIRNSMSDSTSHGLALEGYSVIQNALDEAAKADGGTS